MSAIAKIVETLTLAELRDLPVIEVLKELRTEAMKRNQAEAQRLIDIEKN